MEANKSKSSVPGTTPISGSQVGRATLLAMIGKLWKVQLPASFRPLKLSRQNGENHYYAKYGLESLKDDKEAVVVTCDDQISDQYGLAVGFDVIFLKSRPKEVNFEVVKLLLGENFYFILPKYLERITELEKENDSPTNE